jgi:N-ethylmaleimide reductase
MRDGEMPVGPSAIPATGDFFLPSSRVDFPVPRELGIGELPGSSRIFAQATRNARAAGFDGVELHGANGYLHDQFLQDGSNNRTDAYGGSAENRARLMVETTQAMIDAWEAARVGVRLSPSSYLYGFDDSDKRATFGTVISQLSALGIAYLTLLEPIENGCQEGGPDQRCRRNIPNTGFDKAQGNAFIADGKADAVAFGLPYCQSRSRRTPAPCRAARQTRSFHLLRRGRERL